MARQINLADAASDIDNDPLTFSIVKLPLYGKIDHYPGSSYLTYTIDDTFKGNDSLGFVAIDSHNASSNIGKVTIIDSSVSEITTSTQRSTGDVQSSTDDNVTTLPRENESPPFIPESSPSEGDTSAPEDQAPIINGFPSTDQESFPPSTDNTTTTTPDKPGAESTLFIEVLTGSDPGFRGADQSIFVNVLDYSSRIGIDQAKVNGVLVDGPEGEDFIKNANSTAIVDVEKIDGQKFSGVTDSNGQFSHVTRISEDLDPGTIAIVVTVEASGYQTSSKIGTFKLE